MPQFLPWACLPSSSKPPQSALVWEEWTVVSKQCGIQLRFVAHAQLSSALTCPPNPSG